MRMCSETVGLATSLSVGTTTINLTSGTVIGSATLVVNPAALVSITIAPQNPTIDLGASQQFTATGTYTDGTTQDLTSVATWSSTMATVAVISNNVGSQGLATSSGQGSTTISVTSGSVVGSTSLTVSTAGLVSISVTPANPSISVGSTQQFTATGNYADGTTQNITNFVTWSSDTPTVSTISNTPGTNGLASAIAPGTANITAASGSIVSAPTLLTVIASGPTLTSITVAPSSASIPLGTTQRFTATGNYSDGTTQNLTATATWSSSSTAVATIDQGLASSVSQGTVTISSTSGSITGTASLTITAAALVSIAITPQSPTISVNATEQFTATGTYTDNSTQNITDSVSWTSGTLAVATISSQGVASAVGTGTSTIMAADGSVSSSTELTVIQSQIWTLHGPPGRHSHSAVWDPNSQQMIIFGGEEAVSNAPLNDVWLGTTSVSQNDSFTAESPTGQAPQGRFGHVATYDSSSNRMTIFGGDLGSSCANDVWILSGANGQSGTPGWLSATPSGSTPSARSYAAGVYDPTTNTLIVFGGSNCSGGYFNDVWVLSNANGEVGTPVWSQLSPSGTAPAPRESATAVYDSGHNILIVYAGDAGGSPFGDVWTLSNANGTGGTPTWSKLMPTGSVPSTRTGHTAIYDSTNNRMTIYGGSVTAGFTLNDAWVLTTANGVGGSPGWSQISAQGTAQAD